MHWKKPLGESVTAFTLSGLLDSPSIVSINANIPFAIAGDNTRLPISEVLICAAVGNIARSNKKRDWDPIIYVLLPPFLTKALLLDGETSAEKLLKIFARTIT